MVICVGILQNEVNKMVMRQADINRVRHAVRSQLGNKVMIKANKGRHKIDVTEGIIKETYPSIFIVQVDNKYEDTKRLVSFSYTDVLTKDVKLTLC